MKEITPFTYINAINQGKNIELSSKYSQFLTNRNFSLFKDTILIANESNKFQNIPDNIHFRFMKAMIKPGRRFGTWYKPENSKKINKLSEYYGVSKQKASEIQIFYNDEDIKAMEND